MNRKEVMEKVKAGQQQWMEKAKQLSSEEAAVAAQKRVRTRTVAGACSVLYGRRDTQLR